MYEDFIKSWSRYLVDEWGLDPEFSKRAAALVVWCSHYRLNPRITSGYRDKAFQQYLVDEWNKGNPNVHTPLPPGKSLHNATNWYGGPAALAMDMQTSNSFSAGYLAKQLGLVWGGEKDVVHFGYRSGTL